VLVLGNDPVLRDSIWPINALLLEALTQEILRRRFFVGADVSRL
jgi:hypothetical protein